MKEKNKKIIEAGIIFLLIWVGGSIVSIVLDIKNGLLPSFFLGTAIAVWRYKAYGRK